MKLVDITKLDEERIMAALRGGKQTAIYKNPTPEELEKVSLRGVVKGVLTPTSFIAYDFQNVDKRDLPPLNGYPVVLYFSGSTTVTVQLIPFNGMDNSKFEDVVKNNQYLSQFNIKDVLQNEAE